jgi:ATP-dependent Clp protease adaptor protein ClpS
MSEASEGDQPTLAKPKPSAVKKNKPRSLPPYHVVLLDDNDHTHEYVIEMVMSLFGHGETMAAAMAKEVHESGRVILLTTHRERAELKRDQIHAWGKDQRVATCKGSMSAVVEPAEG